MIRTAVIFVSGPAGDPSIRIAGLGLLERALLAAARAGVRRAFVVGTAQPLPHDPRFPEDLRILPSTAGAAMEIIGGAAVADGDLVFAIHAAAVFLPAALRRLAEAAETRGMAQAVGQGGPLTLAAVPARSLPKAWPALLAADAGELRNLLGAATVACASDDGGFAAQLANAADIPAIERGLLRGLENPRDGRVDRAFNRPLSRPLSRLFLRTPLTPNQITVLSFLVAMLGAAAFAQGTYLASLLGALLLQLAAVLDCCDGEVARVKFRESQFGDALDITLDSIANAAIFAGIARGALVTRQLAAGYALGMAAALGIMGSFVVVTYVERWLPEPAATPEHRLAQRLVAAMTSRDFSVIVFLSSLTATLPWFLWGSAIGANVFWLFLLALVVRGRTPRIV